MKKSYVKLVSLCDGMTFRIMVFLVILTFYSISLSAQIILAPDEEIVTRNVEVSFFNDVFYTNPSWTTDGGSIIHSTYSDGTYRIWVTWSTSGLKTIEFLEGSTVQAATQILITDPRPPVPNATFTINSQPCAVTTITRNTNPPNGNIVWYWQSSSNGRTETLGSATTLSLSTTGPAATYYLRAKASNLPSDIDPWSSSSQTVGTVTVTAPLSTPVSAGSASRNGPGPLTIYVNPVEGASYYLWYEQPTGGSPDPGQMTSSYSFTNLIATKTMWVVAANPSCATQRVPITATILPNPIVQPTTTGIISPGGTISLTTQSFSNYVWHYHGYSTGPVTVGYTQQVLVNKPGPYSVTVTDPAGTATSPVFTVVDALSSQDMNFVEKTYLHTAGVKELADVFSLGLDKRAKLISYRDGAGSLIQHTAIQSSRSEKDVVEAYAYDAFGRAEKSYLPIVVDQISGAFVPNLISEGAYTSSLHYLFYNSSLALNEGVARDMKPYSTVVLESSPLRRVIQQGSIGEGYQPGQAYRKYIRGVNSSNEVRDWFISATTNLPEGFTYASPGVLSMDVVEYWEDGQRLKESVVYTNLKGLKVLERTKNGSGWNDEYYIYDIQGRLVYVLPPQLVREITANPTQAQLDRLAFQYVYDEIGRRIAAKKPGMGWTYMVYDKRNRPVFVQDATQALSGKWSYIKFDRSDRPVIGGIYTPPTPINRSDLQLYVNGLNNGLGYENTFLPNGNPGFIQHGATIQLSAPPTMPEYQGSTSIVLKPGFQYAASTTGSLTMAIGDGMTNVRSTFPYRNHYELSITYYDSYLANDGLFLIPELQFLSETWITTVDIEPFQKFNRVKGKITGSSVRILNSNTWLHSVNYYDKKQRLIQTVMQSHIGGTERYSILYNFAELARETILTHSQGTRIVRRNEYDNSGRLLKSYHRLNAQPEVLLTALAYNEMGAVIDRKIHSTDNGSTFLQSHDYRYNIKGWLTGLNEVPDSNEQDFFSLALTYDQTIGSENVPRKDGLLSAVQWKSDMSLNKKMYSFSYKPNLTYITDAIFKAAADGTTWNKDIDMYSEKGMTYDANGNITHLTRHRVATTVVDDLQYNYGSPTNNQLMKVIDQAPASTKAMGFQDGTNSDNDYEYDLTGNLIVDRNKGIANITYNILNLPDKITFASGAYIAHLYDGVGVKLAQNYYTAGNQLIASTDFRGECVYENQQLSYILHEQGKIRPPSYNNLLKNREAGSLSGFAASGNVSTVVTALSSETYLEVTSNQNGGAPGIFPIDGPISVIPGETYAFKVLGYRHTSGHAYLKVWGNGSAGDIVAQGAELPLSQMNEAWITATFTVPADVSQIKLGVLWNAPVSGDKLFINRVALYRLDWRYEYEITDHLGSVRAVVSATPVTINYGATMEPVNVTYESAQFLNINSSAIVPNPAANSTPGGNYVLRLSRVNRMGHSKSMEVYPGDKIDASVMAYYNGSVGNSRAALSTLIAALSGNLGGTNPAAVDGVASAYNNSGLGPFNLLSPNQGTTKPSAFLNYILFDERFQVLEAKSAPLGVPDVKHLVALPPITVKEKGILYVYLSYDDDGLNDVYFDEFKIAHQESSLIEINEYYPFGMQAYNWVRNGETENMYKFQGKYYDSLTQFHDFTSRRYDAAIGRWASADPADQFASPYLAMGNSPINGIDPTGLWFGVDDLIVAAVGFAYGYISHGIRHDDWDKDAIKSGGIHAALFEVGYLTAGGGLTAAGGQVAAGTTQTAVSVTVANASSYLSTNAVSIAANEILPNVSLSPNDRTTLTISPVVTMKGLGASVTTSFRAGKQTIGISAGVTGLYKGGFQAGHGAGVRYFNGKAGLGYSIFEYNGVNPQTLAEMNATWGKGDYEFRLSNDFFPGGDQGDRFRTAAGSLSYKDYSLTVLLHTEDPGLSSEEREKIHCEQGLGVYGHYHTDLEKAKSFRAGIVALGYKNYRFGWNDDGIRNFVQNKAIHDRVSKSPWFIPIDIGSNPYFEIKASNPYSIWGF